MGVVRHYADPLTIALASTSGHAFTKREEECRRLRILYPQLDEGALLIEYLNRQKIDNPPLLLLRQILKDHDYSLLEKLHEALIHQSMI